MPKIPDWTALGGTPSLNSGRKLVSASDVDTSARYAGMARLGAALAGIGEKRKNEEDALDILKAETQHKRDLVDIERDLDNDPDYDNHDKNFTERSSKSATDASSVIRNPQAREHWRLRAELENETARARVVKRADAFGRQERVGEFDRVVQDLQKGYSDPSATSKQRQEALAGIDNAITLAQRSGLMTPRAAAKYRERILSSAEEYAVHQRINQGDDLETIIKDLQGGVPEAAEIGDINLKAADETLKLTPQEKALYQRHLGNLTGEGGVDAADGSRLTLGQTTIAANNRFYNIPTVWDGKTLSDAEAAERATKEGLDNFPAYASPEEAGERLQQLDSYMEKDAAAHLKGRQAKQPRQSLTERIAAITTSAETRETDPLKGIANISPDSRGSRSYGNFGLNSGPQNSGGSIHAFVREHGERFGLTAKPGTRAFDEQWRNAAGASPVELREAELDWYEGNILPRIETDLTAAGVPVELAGDPRVKAYFADRMIQYGEESLKTYGRRIGEAAGEAGNNPITFLQNMDAADRANMKTDFRSAIASGVYGTKGHNTRLNKRLRGALGVGESGEEVQYGGPYQNLTLPQRSRLLNAAKIANRNLLLQGLRDATAEIRRTGRAPKDERDRTAIDRARLSLQPNQLAKAELDWQEAESEYKAISPLANLSTADALDHVDKLTPGSKLSNEHYAIADRVQKKANDEWKKIQRQREDDPAAAVDKSPEVAEVRHTFAIAGNRASPAQRNEMLIEARRSAQERLGIPEFQRRILTEAEAAELLQIPRNPDNPDDIDNAISGAVERAEQLYGKYAMEALDSAVSVHLKGGKDARVAARDLVARLKAQREAPPPKPSFWQSLFGGGSAPVEPGKGGGKPASVPAPAPAPSAAPVATPNPAQIQWLLADPANRQAAFDEKFGPGTAVRAMQAQELNARQGIR